MVEQVAVNHEAIGSTPTEGTKKKYADLLAYINYNTYLCNIKLKQYDRYIWRQSVRGF